MSGQRKLVHKQFNSPMGLYSQQNVKETLDRELKAFGEPGLQIDDSIGKSLNLANSAVLRAVEEEEQIKCGYKRVAWPPASEERVVREFTPQPQIQSFSPQPSYEQSQQQHQHQPQHHQPPQQQAPQQQYNSVAPPTSATSYSNPSYKIPQNSSYPNQYPSNGYAQQPYAQQPQHQQQPIQYTQAQFNRQSSREPAGAVGSSYPSYTPTAVQHAPSSHQPASSDGWKPITPPVTKKEPQYTAQSGSTSNYNRQPDQGYQQQQKFGPISQNNSNYQPQIQQQPQQQPQSQPMYNNVQQQYQPPQSQGSQQPSWAHQQQQPQQYQAQPQYQPQSQFQQPSQYQAPSNYQSQTQPQQYQPNQYNSYSQPPPSASISHDQPDYQQQPQQQFQQPYNYRGASPGIMKLREQTPVNQQPAPVYTSQPAAVSYQGGNHLRGDLKWPPPEYKEAAARENEERRQLALGPVCRPRRHNRTMIATRMF